MDSKYYTPNIEEFHVGFEYESLIYYYKDEYETLTIKTTSDLIQELQNYASNDMDYVRVKYLDKEDIESLGLLQQNLSHHFKNNNYLLIERQEQHQYIIVDLVNDDQIFIGKIKNKSELVVLLKQLNVL